MSRRATRARNRRKVNLSRIQPGHRHNAPTRQPWNLHRLPRRPHVFQTCQPHLPGNRPAALAAPPGLGLPVRCPV